MKVRHGKISTLVLFIVTCITVVFVVVELRSKARVRAHRYEEKIAAAELTLRSFREIKQASDSLHIPIDRINDPNGTGLIGLQYSHLTTQRGDLNAKLTSTNPNFAALIVHLLTRAQVGEQDIVAVSFTGSYPALNIAALCAFKVMNIEPIIVTSCGASMWGANYPYFTYLDMEHTLHANGIVEHRTMASTVGGEDDVGRGLSPEGRDLIETAITRNDIAFLAPVNLDEAIEKRVDLYGAQGKVKVFLHIGEASSWSGNYPSGFFRPRQIRSGGGLLETMSRKGIAVINVMDVTAIASDYDLPPAPTPLPAPGEGKLFYEYRYSVPLAIIFLAILLFILFVVLRYDVDYYLRRRKK
jgi:poly-gamma-glutamate system protein